MAQRLVYVANRRQSKRDGINHHPQLELHGCNLVLEDDFVWYYAENGSYSKSATTNGFHMVRSLREDVRQRRLRMCGHEAARWGYQRERRLQSKYDRTRRRRHYALRAHPSQLCACAQDAQRRSRDAWSLQDSRRVHTKRLLKLGSVS